MCTPSKIGTRREVVDTMERNLSKFQISLLLGLIRHSYKRIGGAVQFKQGALEMGDENTIKVNDSEFF